LIPYQVQVLWNQHHSGALSLDRLSPEAYD
jgi:hypothetical protein